jgi:adenosylhomocysteine nucleosidase
MPSGILAEQTVGVIAAMPEELEAVLARISDPKMEEIAGRTFVTGRLEEQQVVATIAQVGKVAAATTATLLLHQYHPEAVIMTGLAGSVSANSGIGDVVVATQTLQHDLGRTPISKSHEVPVLGIARFDTNPDWTEKAITAASDFITEEMGDRFKVHNGLVITGDRFIQSAEQIANLRASIPDAIAVEMEGGAVAQVCYYFDVPFALIRTISDGGDEAAKEHFSESLNSLAAHYAAGIIPRILAA